MRLSMKRKCVENAEGNKIIKSDPGHESVGIQHE